MQSLSLSGAETPSTPLNGAPLDVTLANFKEAVIEASQSSIVLLDFWAPWCGPCKQLGPLLEKVVGQTGGAVKLTKVNIDQEPQIAQQMHVQSVPAVFAFWQGQPVDGFMGAIPESQLKQWIAQLVQVTGAKGETDDAAGIELALDHAQECFDNGDIVTAKSIYEDLAAEFPQKPEPHAGTLKCLIAQGELEAAQSYFDTLDPKLARDKTIEAQKSALELALQAASLSGDTQSLQKAIEANPNDHQARYDLALVLVGAGQHAQALEELLDIVRRDRKWNDEAARLQILKIFEALGPMHEITVEARKKLSSILFA
ncbi:MAG: thioredoxin [Alphaproteobacteria bacterium]|jgi:putative thioredoxin|nr:thioredoxin [Alphaproteobacteria bacterium]